MLAPSLTALLLATLVLAPGAPTEPRELERCKVALVEGRCATISVPERRDAEDGRRIELFVSIFPATGEQRQDDPIVVLEGGPGASVSHFAGLHLQTFAAARRSRDLVLLDQRGTGRSSALDCDLMQGFRALPTPESTARCRDTLSSSADLSRYTTAEVVADLTQVLDYLGYQRVNLFGSSNGTRTALRFLAAYPDRVRTMTLLAPYPTTRNVLVESGETLDRSLRGQISACLADATCRDGYPDLAGTLEAVVASHSQDPAWPVFSSGVRMMLFFPLQASRVPQLLDMVERAGHVPEPTSGPQDSLLAGWISQGAFMSILCSEDAARTSVETIRERAAGTFLGPGWAESLERSCEQWPRRPLPADFSQPVESDVPALLLVGSLDPAMPPSWAREIAGSLPNARVVEVPEGQHSFIGMSGTVCVLELMNDLLASGSTEGLDPSCTADMHRPPFAPAAE